MPDIQPLRDQHVLIAGLDPRLGGGVPGMMSATARNLRALGASVSYIHLAQAPSKRHRTHEFEWDGARCIALRYRRTPNTFLNYLAAADEAREFTREFDTLFVAGASQAAMLFWSDERAYRAWLATTIADEYRSRVWRRELSDRHWGWMLNRMLMPATKRFERAAVDRATQLFALSRATRRRFAVEYSRENTYLPFPMDTVRFSPGDMGDTPAIIYVGRVDDDRKNVPLLLRAFQRVLSRVPAAELWLVGRFEKEGAVARFARTLGLGASVSFMGPQPDDALVDLYRRAAVFALPSRQEGLGIVVLEAMACGLPVVATRSGGPEEDVLASDAGTLVHQDDDASFADALCEVLENGEVRRARRRNAIDFVRREHSDAAFRAVLEPSLVAEQA